MKKILLSLLAGALLAGGVLAGAWSVDGADSSSPAVTPDSTTVVDQQAVQSGRALAQELSAAFQHAAEQVKPSVVPVYSERLAPAMAGGPLPDDMLRRFFGDRAPRVPRPDAQRPRMRGLGSGVIVSDQGYILTNNHVVAEAEELHVVLGDERIEAELVGTDSATDLAVIKIDPESYDGPLPVVELGSSAGVQVGQWVIAVGNPFELLQTVTAGIVSATGRAAGLAVYEDFIQTDASINTGNSGGALADLDGRVIGINTAISSPSGGNVGIGFAIPIDMAKRVMDDLIEDGEVARGYLALLPQDIDEDLAAALELESREGTLVADVTRGGPADKAGFERGDVILSVDGEPISDSADLRNRVAAIDPGETIEVTVLRDGRERDLRVELGERPPAEGERRALGRTEQEGHEKLGLSLTDLNDDLRRRLGVDQDTEGVVVTGVAPGSPAGRVGLQRGDLIVEVAGEEVTSIDEILSALESKESGDRVALVVRRGELSRYVAIEIP